MYYNWYDLLNFEVIFSYLVGVLSKKLDNAIGKDTYYLSKVTLPISFKALAFLLPYKYKGLQFISIYQSQSILNPCNLDTKQPA